MKITIDSIKSNSTGGITEVKWTMTASKGNFTLKDVGVSKFSPNHLADGFIPFANVKEADVIAWIQGTLDASKINLRLDEGDAASSSSQSTAFPWA